MSGSNITIEELGASVTLVTGARHVLRLDRIQAYLLELDQVCFAFGSSILLPQVLPEHCDLAGSIADTSPNGSARLSGQRANGTVRIAPLVALKGIFDFAERNAGLKILIVGHTDTVGSAQINLQLSERRARNVYSLLAGDKAEWARSCVGHTVLDLQLVLDWAARAHGFSCFPGRLDGVFGQRTRRACERFRRHYNASHAGVLALDPVWGEEDWKVVFDLYERTLSRYLDIEVNELAAKRALLQFKSPPVLACGEHWPISSVAVDNLRSLQNRRVDVLFIEDKVCPPLSDELPPGKSLYGRSLRFHKEVVECTPDILELRLLSAEGYPIPDAHYVLHLADGSMRQGTLDHLGTALERQVPDGAFHVEYAPLDEIRARALAARLRNALVDPFDWRGVYQVLSQSSGALEQIHEAYAQYFDTLRGQGMREDVLATAQGTEHAVVVDHLLAASNVAALATNANVEVLNWKYPTIPYEERAE